MSGAQPIPQGDYVAATRHGGLIHTAGMTPRKDGRMIMTGPIRAGEIESFEAAVTLACANALAAAEAKLEPGETLAAILTMTVYVAAEEGFAEHSKVADIASAHLRRRLGSRGQCSRAAVGVASLPGRAPVEIQIVAAV
ncbi:RidA family protein [Limimaricola pyoseonensis]|uniref:Enamine deaminase RidA, house cleaning of reactive enamine intermediates, YjgF/YER057c/UK114 family n=1 Tax=Limimaricola pyoseonensis TaxID=521013 RepID=A0A1G7CBZ3_9RHOB|nr:RidA family protein [Limimaricola pyoseonensis]SDE36858.1 Enamine deaminase RidA, house cleaning of reactive enamine intermediates, YjgF/YER057c/UK114 family [Limimaricola pyoseonensis]